GELDTVALKRDFLVRLRHCLHRRNRLCFGATQRDNQTNWRAAAEKTKREKARHEFAGEGRFNEGCAIHCCQCATVRSKATPATKIAPTTALLEKKARLIAATSRQRATRCS